MRDGTPAAYEPLDLSLVALPPRSRLYSLEPVGVGTPMVEGLTGYAARLAETHGVSTAALFGWELFPLMNRPRARKLESVRSKSALLALLYHIGKGRAINGTGMEAQYWTGALAAATSLSELRFLTLLPWRNVLSHFGLIRLTKGWCPACLEEWRLRGSIIYEPLLWSLSVITLCPSHQILLQTKCPSCRRHVDHVASHSRPGFCSACGQWLGSLSVTSSRDGEALTETELTRQSSVSAKIGEMLAAAPSLTQDPLKEVVSRSTKDCVRGMTAGGSVSAFCRALKLSKDAVGNWIRGKSKALIDMLLPICVGAAVSPLNFLTGNLKFRLGPNENSKTGRDDRDIGPVVTVVPRRKSIDVLKAEEILRATLEEEPPPTMIEVAGRLGHPTSALRYRFPELCQAIVYRYKARARDFVSKKREEARHTLEVALTDEDCPSVADVARRMGWHLSTLIDTFPVLCGEISKRRLGLKKASWAQVGEKLREMLTEQPPPPMHVIVDRLKRSESSLYNHFPVLCRRLGARHKEYRQNSFKRRGELFLTEVRRVAVELHRSGINPSMRRVEARLSGSKSLRGNRSALAVLREVRTELGLC